MISLSFFYRFLQTSSFSFRDIVKWLGYCLIVFFAAGNITSFHLIPMWYQDIIQGKKDIFIHTVQRAQGLPFFETLSEEIQDQLSLYDADIFAQKHSREVLREKLIEALTQQPNSTEILKSLILLHEQDGEDEKAKIYSKKLRELDPAYMP